MITKFKENKNNGVSFKMKKIIWVFGQSATGKKTLINRMLKKDSKTLEELGINSQKIIACSNTIVDDEEIKPKIKDTFNYDDGNMQGDNEYFNRQIAQNRRACIMTDCLRFLYDDNDILLIKGQDNDIWPNRGDIVKYFLQQFLNNPNIEIEVFMLSVTSDEVWKRRIVNKEWFQNFKDKETVMQNMLMARKSMKHEKMVQDAFQVYNIPIINICSDDNQYTILGEISQKKGRN